MSLSLEKFHQSRDKIIKTLQFLFFLVLLKLNLLYTFIFFKGAGLTAEKEIGIASTFGKKDFMLFTGECKGLKSDIHIGKSLTIALWKDIDMIEGTVYPATYGMSVPPVPVPGIPSVEAALGSVIGKKEKWSALTPWMVEKIGTEFSISLGGGISPLDISFSQCTTKVEYKCKLSRITLHITT